MELIKTLCESNNDLLKAKAEDFKKWSKLKHTKSCLETFLVFNIAEIIYISPDDGKEHYVFCTTNVPLINQIKSKKKSKKKQKYDVDLDAFKTPDMFSVDAYDLINKYRTTISTKCWQIVDLLSIDEKNVEFLAEAVQKILKI